MTSFVASIVLDGLGRFLPKITVMKSKKKTKDKNQKTTGKR